MDKILLYPGAFAPMHTGHLNLLFDAIKTNNIDKVIFIRNKNTIRHNINFNISSSTIDFLLNTCGLNYYKYECDGPTVKEAYKIVENAKYGNFFLCSGNKGNDFYRQINFYNYFQKYNFSNKNIEISELKLNQTVFKYNDEPISSTIIEEILKKGDYERFYEIYKDLLYIPELKLNNQLLIYLFILLKNVINKELDNIIIDKFDRYNFYLKNIKTQQCDIFENNIENFKKIFLYEF